MEQKNKDNNYFILNFHENDIPEISKLHALTYQEYGFVETARKAIGNDIMIYLTLGLEN